MKISTKEVVIDLATGFKSKVLLVLNSKVETVNGWEFRFMALQYPELPNATQDSHRILDKHYNLILGPNDIMVGCDRAKVVELTTDTAMDPCCAIDEAAFGVLFENMSPLSLVAADF